MLHLGSSQGQDASLLSYSVQGAAPVPIVDALNALLLVLIKQTVHWTLTLNIRTSSCDELQNVLLVSVKNRNAFAMRCE